MPVVTDQLGRSITAPAQATRIISLVPSQTELLHYLGMDSRVIGITKFCIHPERWFRTKTRLGGTKNVNLEQVAALQPDLIIANKEENNQEQIEALAKNYPVWVSDIATMEDARNMIASLGKLLNSEQKSLTLLNAIRAQQNPIPKRLQRAVYLIWNEPIMLAGQGTYISSNLPLAGFENIAPNTRYPALSEQELTALNPEVVLYASEPFPFQEKHLVRFRKLLPNARHLLVDGEAFSWYGSRIPDALEYFKAFSKR